MQNNKNEIVLKKIQLKSGKYLEIYGTLMYTNPCCGMIAMKREVAAKGKSLMAGFPWSECQVRKLTTSHCTDNQVYRRVETT